MNKVEITGRWTRDPMISYTAGENPTCVAKGTIAVNRRGEGADFPSVVAYGKTAEFIQKYFTKGMKADIVGRIQTGKYENKQGQTIYTTDVVIEEIEFGESKKSEKPSDGFADVPDDAELPFN